MAIDLAAVAEYLKLPARIYIAIGMFTAALLFVPTNKLALLSLDEFAAGNRTYIALAFLASMALMLVELGLQGWLILTRYREKTARRKPLDVLRERLNSLTSDEKEMLAPFVLNNVHAQRVPMNSAVRRALESSRILATGSQMVQLDRVSREITVEVIIQPWAMVELQKNPALLDLSPEDLE